MAFEELKAQIAYLLTEMENQPENAHEVYETLREKLNEMRAMGMPVPEDFVELEKRLDAEFSKH